ncbi:ribosome biogenesis ATPase RIX7 [Rhizoctonia solani AG-1 IA]|uniref:Ribosome biogenesis ATPase RIX7 n=1 Tax=Thanatephorus cucumeris (strain AG1-IA) TaxID=983506 RepID=L8WMU7_THACA|nr:ribosome biogenesis ATPase RIX7 [Rhizoctonia solani AG-1 IA]
MALNRSMQNSWNAQRKSRIDLNGDIPSPSASPCAPTPTAAVTPDEPPAPKRKSRSTHGTSKRAKASHEPPTTRLSDLGGVTDAVEKLLELVALPVCHPEVYLHTGVQPPRGVLLHGPPGCGKTMLANAIAGELGVPFISVSAPSVVSGMSGESEKTLRDTFDEAKNTDHKPVIVIGATNRPDSLDPALRRAGRFDHEISMGVPDEAGRQQILKTLLDKLRLAGPTEEYTAALARATPGYVGADLASLTSAAGVIAVKRIFKGLLSGAFITGDEPAIAPPQGASDTSQSTLPNNLLEKPDVPVDDIEMIPPDEQAAPSAYDQEQTTTPVTSALTTLLRSTTLTPEQLSKLTISLPDFLAALEITQPSATREGFTTRPDVSWADIGALKGIREELEMAVVWPIRRPELFSDLGVGTGGRGVLLWGPPGCGKTLLAKAVAGESGANFISVKGPELLNKYVGESERAVRQVFTRARASAPCVVFFDELDALVPRRDDSLSESSARVVNTLLTELDGLTARGAVYVVGATNRPDMLDPAMCRPGRLDKLLYVDLPSPAERGEIMRTLIRGVRLGSAPTVSLESERALIVSTIAQLAIDRCDGYSGADLAALVREAAVGALRSVLLSGQIIKDGPEEPQGENRIAVTPRDFEQALSKLGPSVSAIQRKRYETLRVKFAGGRGGGEVRIRDEGREGEVGVGGESEGKTMK